MRREADLERLRLRAVGAELQRSRRLAQVDAERARERCRRRAPEACDGGGRTERARGRRRVEAARVVHVRPDGDPKPDRDVVAGHDRGEQRSPVCRLLLGDGKCGGDHRRTRMKR